MPDEQSTVFQQLTTFLTKQMRMAHLYQPLMLRTLIEKGGTASLRDIASCFLAHARRGEGPGDWGTYQLRRVLSATALNRLRDSGECGSS